MRSEIPTLTQPVHNSWHHTTKAAMAFAFTTATYLFARTTGFLPSWLGGKTEDAITPRDDNHAIQQNSLVIPQESTVIPRLDRGIHERGTEPSAISLDPAIKSRDDDSNTAPLNAAQRRLLQTGSGVTVVNPIPDQVIEATELYTYDISNVFTGNYTLLTVSLANGSMLPWLSVGYSLAGSYDTPGNAYGVQVQNGLAYVADGYSGLQVLNVSNPFNMTRLGGYDTQGYARGVQVQNGLAYVADWTSGLQVLNVNNPKAITRLGGYDTSGYAQGVQVQDGLAYVADSYELQVLNVSNPLNITRLGSYDTPGSATAVQVQNGLAYVADFNSGLQVLNISDPSNITELSNYDTPGSTFNVQIQAGLAYVADGPSGLQVLNVSNPANITRIGGYDTSGSALSVYVQNSLIYVADYLSGLQVLNISNPLNIIRLGGYDTPGNAEDVKVQNSLVYVADDTSGLQLIDLHRGQLLGTPTAAQVGESYTIRVSAYSESDLVVYEDFQLTVARFPRRVDTSLADRSVLPDQTLLADLDSDVLFIDPSGGTLILDIQLFSLTAAKQLPRTLLQLNPTFLGSYDTLGNVRNVQIQNGIAYVADGSGGLQVLNVNNPASISHLGSSSVQAYNVQVLNGLAYVVDGYSGLGLHVLNVSNPSNITRLGGYDTPGTAWSVQVQNSLAYVADYDSGLQILNVSNSRNITWLGSYDTPGAALDVRVQNGVAYVADQISGLQILNISNPRNITYVGSYDTPSYSFGVQVQEGIAYVADTDSGLQILNISNASNVVRLGSYDTPYNAIAVQVQNSIAYVADALSGLQILNVSNPRNITSLGSYDTPSWAYGVQVQNGVAYVADDYSGLQILDLTQWQWSVTPSFAEVGNYRVTITATNELGGTASDSFELRVEGGPRLNPNITIPQLFAKVGVPFNYFIPQGLLSDPNNDPISFSARSADNSSLPSWLSFNGISATFSGLAQSSDVGNYSLRIIATDNVPGTLNAETVFRVLVDHLPYVNQRVSDQVAGVGFFYNFTVPSNTFIDPDAGDVLSYNTSQRDGSALPTWLSFNSVTRRFAGAPNSTNTGSYSLVLSATDPHQGMAQTDFNLLVEQFPVANLNQTIIAPVAGIGQPWAMTLPVGSFVDGDDTQFTYRITRADGGPLPSWLSFNSFSGALLGVPQATSLGLNTFRVTASDPHGGSAYRDFNVTVVYFPSVANAIPKPAPSRILRPFNFTISPQTFSDLDSPVLNYTASLSSSQPLPAWLTFNAQNLTLSGTPNISDAGTFNLLIQAQDATGGSIGAPMEVVIQPNFPPQLATQISNQVANVLDPFDFYVPVGAFQDGNGDALNYSACLSGGGQFPAWLKFDATTLHFHGTPSRSDTGDFSQRTLSVDLTAADDLSQTTTNFKISVQGNSSLALFFKIGGPLFTIAGLAFGLYKKRSLLINRCQKEKYQKLNHTAVMGETFFYQLETPVNQVAKVQVKLPGEAKGNDLVNFFKSSHDRLPGHLEMPNWMIYDTETNAVRSKDRVPTTLQYKQLIIQVKDAANITREEFVLDVLPSSASTNTTGEQIAIGVDEIKHVPQSESEGLVDPISPDSPSPSGHSNPFGFLSSSQSVLRSGASSPMPKKAKVEEVTGKEMELTTVSSAGSSF